MKDSTKEALDRYRDFGVPTGDFLRAVLRNDLVDAFGRADYQNSLDMREIIGYVYNELPAPCWRTQEKIDKWISHEGLSGFQAMRDAERAAALAAEEGADES